MKNYAREAISKIGGYVPGEQPRGLKRLIKLNTNENPYPPSPKVEEALKSFDYRRLRLYPDPCATELRNTAARVYGVKPEQVICGNGSDELLTIALRTFVGEGECYAYTEPSYSLYPVLSDIQGAKPLPIPLDENFDIPENAAELAKEAKLIMLARPNAPTGNLPDEGRLRKLCRNANGVVWVDEAYADFAGSSFIGEIANYPNVIVSRTFSKSFSLAGLRIGLAFAPEALINEMNKVRDSYNIDFLTQAVAKAALEDVEYMRANAAKICATRDWLSEELRKMGCKVLPSQSNFIFVKPKRPASEIFTELRKDGFIVRYFNLPRISEFIRVTMGTRGDMESFLEEMRQLDK